MIDCGLIPRLIHLLREDEFDVKKEAMWALSNLTSGGTPEQLECVPASARTGGAADAARRFAISQGLIAAVAPLLRASDDR